MKALIISPSISIQRMLCTILYKNSITPRSIQEYKDLDSALKADDSFDIACFDWRFPTIHHYKALNQISNLPQNDRCTLLMINNMNHPYDIDTLKALNFTALIETPIHPGIVNNLLYKLELLEYRKLFNPKTDK